LKNSGTGLAGVAVGLTIATVAAQATIVGLWADVAVRASDATNPDPQGIENIVGVPASAYEPDYATLLTGLYSDKADIQAEYDSAYALNELNKQNAVSKLSSSNSRITSYVNFFNRIDDPSGPANSALAIAYTNAKTAIDTEFSSYLVYSDSIQSYNEVRSECNSTACIATDPENPTCPPEVENDTAATYLLPDSTNPICLDAYHRKSVVDSNWLLYLSDINSSNDQVDQAYNLAPNHPLFYPVGKALIQDPDDVFAVKANEADLAVLCKDVSSIIKGVTDYNYYSSCNLQPYVKPTFIDTPGFDHFGFGTIWYSNPDGDIHYDDNYRRALVIYGLKGRSTQNQVDELQAKLTAIDGSIDAMECAQQPGKTWEGASCVDSDSSSTGNVIQRFKGAETLLRAVDQRGVFQ
jgi:hypothetical protein